MVGAEAFWRVTPEEAQDLGVDLLKRGTFGFAGMLEVLTDESQPQERRKTPQPTVSRCSGPIAQAMRQSAYLHDKQLGFVGRAFDRSDRV
jgi:hypothetical protein